MSHRTVVCSTLALLLTLLACSHGDAHADAHTAPASDFSPPGADGMGVAAGLRYREVVTGGARPDDRLPLLVIMHGLGDSPGPQWLEVFPLDMPARVIMPQAPKPYGSGYSWFDFRVGDSKPEALGRDIAARAAHVAAFLELIASRRPTRGDAVVAGFSQGGMLSFALSVLHPAHIALAIPISGALPEPIWPKTRRAAATGPKIRALHGDNDPIVPVAPTAALVERLRELGYDATLQRAAGVGHTIAQPMRRTFMELVRAAFRTGAK